MTDLLAFVLLAANVVGWLALPFARPAPEPRRVGDADRDGFIPVDRSWFEEGKR